MHTSLYDEPASYIFVGAQTSTNTSSSIVRVYVLVTTLPELESFTTRDTHSPKLNMQSSPTAPGYQRTAFVSPVVNRSRLYARSALLNSHFQSVRELHISTLSKIRAFQSEISSQSFIGILRQLYKHILHRNNPSCDVSQLVAQDHVVGLVQHFYPRRVDIPVDICDFGLGKAQKQRTTLSEAEQCTFASPST